MKGEGKSKALPSRKNSIARLRGRERQGPASTSGRLFAIGDIHGCVDELTAMLTAVAPARGDTVVFVGDYIDRGPAAREVINFLLELRRGHADYVFLKGNHEDMMLSFLGR